MRTPCFRHPHRLLPARATVLTVALLTAALLFVLPLSAAGAVGLSGLRRQSDTPVPSPAAFSGILPLQASAAPENALLAPGLTGSVLRFTRPAEDALGAFLGAYAEAAVSAGLTVTREESPAYGLLLRLTDAQGLRALLLTEAEAEALVLVLETGMHLSPLPTQSPAPTAAPTAAPEHTSAPQGRWVWVEEEQDCPACVGGVCPVCHGTGSYRLYGEQVLCSPLCSACNGRGTYSTRRYVYLPD